MNDKKVAFIICSNNSLYYEECAWYINRLHIPEGYETDIIRISDAESMAQGYNAAMESSDAKYKIYLHQDVFIYNSNFIDDILEIFMSDSQIGMIGMIGGINLPDDANIWNAWNVGCTYGCNIADAFPVVWYQNPQIKCIEVEAIDGMLMATQYDVKWREDLMLGWDFYDISESLEFTKNGYKVIIPYQQTPWCMHDCGHSKLLHYDESRKKMLEEYSDRFPAVFVHNYNQKYIQEQEKVFLEIKKCIEERDFAEALKILNAIKGKDIVDNNLQYASNLLEIYLSEKETMEETEKFFDDFSTWNELREKYDRIKFLIRRVENNMDDNATDNILNMLEKKEISKEAILNIVMHSATNKKNVIEGLVYRYEKQINTVENKSMNNTQNCEGELVRIKQVISQIEKLSCDIEKKLQSGIKPDTEVIRLISDTMKEVDKITGLHSHGEWETFYNNMEHNKIPVDFYEKILEWKEEVLEWLDALII